MGNFVKDLREIGIVKTLRFNLRYFGWMAGWRMPVLISRRTSLKCLGGSVTVPAGMGFGKVRIGFNPNSIVDFRYERSVWDVTGHVEFQGKCRLCAGCRIVAGGRLTFGERCCFVGLSRIIANDSVTIGADSLFSWDIQIMDTDFHRIMDSAGRWVNPPRPVVIGPRVWMGCKCTVLKGVSIPEGSVIAAGTMVVSSLHKPSAVYGGNPVRELRSDVSWEF